MPCLWHPLLQQTSKQGLYNNNNCSQGRVSILFFFVYVIMQGVLTCRTPSREVRQQPLAAEGLSDEDLARQLQEQEDEELYDGEGQMVQTTCRATAHACRTRQSNWKQQGLSIWTSGLPGCMSKETPNVVSETLSCTCTLMQVKSMALNLMLLLIMTTSAMR